MVINWRVSALGACIRKRYAGFRERCVEHLSFPWGELTVLRGTILIGVTGLTYRLLDVWANAMKT